MTFVSMFCYKSAHIWNNCYIIMPNSRFLTVKATLDHSWPIFQATFIMNVYPLKLGVLSGDYEQPTKVRTSKLRQQRKVSILELPSDFLEKFIGHFRHSDQKIENSSLFVKRLSKSVNRLCEV